MSTVYCFFKNEMIPIEKAGVSVNDLLVQRGYGIFDYLRVQNNKPLFLEDHLDRFYNSASIMHLKIKESREDIKKIVDELVSLNNIPYSGLKLLIAGGETPDGYSVTQPHLIVLQIAITTPPPQKLSEKGFHLCSYNYQRQFAEVKSVDYLMDIWLFPWLKSKNGDDVLYHDNGLVRECPRANIFMVDQQNVLITPVNKMLKGITRKHILLVAQRLGIQTEERDVTLEEFYQAKEVFESSSTKRILPVFQLDDVVYTNYGTDSVMHRLFEGLQAREIEILEESA